MPNITLTVSSGVAARIIASLNGTPYPKTEAGVKELLTDYLKSRVKEYERSKAEQDAVAALSAPAELNVS